MLVNQSVYKLRMNHIVFTPLLSYQDLLYWQMRLAEIWSDAKFYVIEVEPEDIGDWLTGNLPEVAPVNEFGGEIYGVYTNE